MRARPCSRPGPGPAVWAVAVTAAAVTATAALAGCGSAGAAGPAPGAAAGPRPLSLATALVSGSGTGWAVMQLGGSSAQHENFWQLFVRPPGAVRWRLATPAGVASNGGLVIAATGASSLVAGFRPSQDLTFSPLAASADEGASWSQATLVSPGLADLPGGLAASPGGRLIALTDEGQAQLSTRMGARWATLTSARALAKSAPGRACGLTGLTAAAWTPAGTPLLAGACARTGMAGIFALRDGAWHAAGPALPGSLADHAVEVVGLSSTGNRTTAVLAAGHGGSAGLAVAWSGDGGGHWTVSPVAATGTGELRSLSILTGGSAGIVLTGGRGETIAGPGAAWRQLPGLPAGTATLAAGAAGQLDALSARGSTLTAWRLGAGQAGWIRMQTTHVAIPYGSSG